MSILAEKRDRFELLMKQANVPTEMIDEFFHEGYIDRVEVSRTNREWTFHLNKRHMIPRDIYLSFCRHIKEQFAHIAKIQFVIQFSDEVENSLLVEEYWPLFLEWVQRELPSVNGWMTKASMEVSGSTIRVNMLDQTGLELAKKRSIDAMIVQFFHDYFGRTVQVKFGVQESRSEEYERFQQQIEEEERAYTQNLMAQSMEIERSKDTGAPDAEISLMLGHEIKDQPVPIQQIQDEEKKVTLQGTVLKLEEKELRNGSTLFSWILTDFTDSLTIKAFAKNKEDLKVLKLLANGKWIRVRGKVEYDRFMQIPELVMLANDLNEVSAPPERMDDAEEKRVEFHLHSSMSTMDGITPIGDYVKMAAKWGMPAIAVTDHANVQSFPEAFKAAQKNKIKVIYGVEANIVNDAVPIVRNADDRVLENAEYVVFDIETTGLSVINHKIIEIAAVRMAEGKEVDRFSTFVNPHERIPYNITQLTSITDEMVKDAPDIEPIIQQFAEFVGDAVLVAHNAQFDMGFVQASLKRIGRDPLPNPVLDTLELARFLHPTMKNHRLNTLSDKYKVSLENHHRAIDDTLALGEVLFHLLKEAAERQITRLSEFNRYVGNDLRTVRPFHACVYAKNATGKKNLFKLISMSNTEYYHRVACIPRSKLIEMREGLIVISGCERGEFYEAVLNKSQEEAEEVAQFYDVLEIQPVDVNMHLVEKGFVSRDQLIEANRRVLEIGRKLGKPVIATGNVHYLHPREKIHRDITILGITGFSPLKDIKKPDVHFRTTKEMLQAFEHLGTDEAYRVVVTNTRKLADEFEEIEMFNSQPYFPIIEGADDELRTTCYKTAKELYGEPLPEIITERLEKEIVPITKAGFSALYLISARLVKKSNEDGYLVGSRGSVGSSIVAMMLGISEVNPLQPHYLCAKCKHSEWFTDGSVMSGFDLPDKQCPECGEKMRGDGQDIPFETFLGFKGDKVPDIDLNFSGEYQPNAHNYTKVMFGEKNVFRAGTIGTVAEKTAYGFVKKYEEEYGKHYRSAEANRLSLGCTGVKRSTGQHPGGIVVVPDYIDVEDVTPVQFPADDTSADWKTTHFDYHAFDANLLKLDILGHDDPTMMRMLQDLTGVDPTQIPMNDPKVMSMFNSTEAIGVRPDEIRSPVATFGIPEMGTKFVRQMLEETKPSTFADLLQISGLSHGTGVWLGNAQELIKRGICTIKTVIGCRDNIMLYLIYRGMDAGLAFKITESVRKGKGLTDEWIEEMKKQQVPDWYIDSCLKIEYMFPRAHAAAYVTSAVRTAYFKLYYPVEFYATYFTVRASEDFDVETFCAGHEGIRRKIQEIEEKGFSATAKEKGMVSILEMGLEMTARGFSVKGIDLYRSDATKFTIDGNALIPPFSAIQGVGVNAARNIAASREEGEYLSVEDFQNRSKATKSIVEILTGFGCFRGLPESNQLSLF